MTPLAATALSPEALRVFADELLEKGDVHGEFILLQCERAARAERLPSARERELEVLLWQRTADLLQVRAPALSWRLGLLDSIHLEVDDALVAELERLAQWPMARALRTLSLRGGHVGAELTPFLKNVHRLHFPELRELRVDIIDFEVAIGDVSPLSAHWSQLEVLELHGVLHQLGNIVLPSLKSFSASYLQPDCIAALVNAQWPKLEGLELAFAETPAEAEPVFGALLEAPMSPVLQSVRIRSPWPEFFRAALPKSRLGRGRAVQVE